MNFSLRISGLLLLILISAGGLSAQSRQWAHVLDNTYQVNRPADEIVLEIAIESGYHIQSNRPEDPLLIPTELTFEWPEGITNDTIHFPPAESYTLMGTESVLQVYGGIIRVRLPLNVQMETDSGTYNIPGLLRYQACDDRKCYFPRDLEFFLRIIIP